MRLLTAFYSNGGQFAPGWWIEVEDDAGERRSLFLWEDEAEPVFGDLADVVSEFAPVHGLDAALELARRDEKLVGREPMGDYEPPAVLASSEDAEAPDDRPCGPV